LRAGGGFDGRGGRACGNASRQRHRQTLGDAQLGIFTRGARLPRQIDEASSVGVEVAHPSLQRSAAQLLDQFLDELPEDQRDIFLLAEVEQMTANEIGDVLEMNPNTVRTRLRTARMSVQASLARHRAAERWRDG
jgi:RNA polymerase sigma factor (sigma-70 family)